MIVAAVSDQTSTVITQYITTLELFYLISHGSHNELLSTEGKCRAV